MLSLKKIAIACRLEALESTFVCTRTGPYEHFADIHAYSYIYIYIYIYIYMYICMYTYVRTHTKSCHSGPRTFASGLLRGCKQGDSLLPRDFRASGFRASAWGNLGLLSWNGGSVPVFVPQHSSTMYVSQGFSCMFASNRHDTGNSHSRFKTLC